MSDGAKIEVDLWAKARASDLHIFVQETHHARRLGGEYAPSTVEDWDAAFGAWLVAKGRVCAVRKAQVAGERLEADARAFASQPIFLRDLPAGTTGILHDTGAVVAHIGEPIDLGEMEAVAADPEAAAETVVAEVKRRTSKRSKHA